MKKVRRQVGDRPHSVPHQIETQLGTRNRECESGNAQLGISKSEPPDRRPFPTSPADQMAPKESGERKGQARD